MSRDVKSKSGRVILRRQTWGSMKVKVKVKMVVVVMVMMVDEGGPRQ